MLSFRNLLIGLAAFLLMQNAGAQNTKPAGAPPAGTAIDRKSTRLNSSH